MNGIETRWEEGNLGDSVKGRKVSAVPFTNCGAAREMRISVGLLCCQKQCQGTTQSNEVLVQRKQVLVERCSCL